MKGYLTERAPQVRIACRLFAALSLLSGCSSNDALTAYSEQPAVYVVLRPAADRSTPDTLRALLVTTGTPLNSAYRNAELFQLERTSDDSVLLWRSSGKVGRLAEDYRTLQIGDSTANYFLPPGSPEGGRGSEGIIQDERFELLIKTGGVSIRGSTYVPGQPRLVVRRFVDSTVVHWNRVLGAAGYLVIAETELQRGRILADTNVVLRFDRQAAGVAPAPHLKITALDTNAFRYFTDTLVVRAGLVGAYGLLGALGIPAELTLSP